MSYRKVHSCPDCGSPAEIEHVYFVDLDAWPDFFEPGDSGLLPGLRCLHCGRLFASLAPVLVLFPRQRLLVFVTHGEDDGGPVDGAMRYLAFVEMTASSGLHKELCSLPFSIVSSWRGLRLLHAGLNGEALSEDLTNPDCVPENWRAQGLIGYIYGDVMFYDVRLRPISEPVDAIIACSDIPPVRPIVAKVAERVLDVLGWTDPGLATALGRLLLEQGRKTEALTWLRESVASQSRWLAPTARFVDATPRNLLGGDREFASSRRPDFARPAKSLGLVTETPHCVSVLEPRPRDLWHWPVSEPVYAQQFLSWPKIFSVFGLAIGMISQIDLSRSMVVFDVKKMMHVADQGSAEEKAIFNDAVAEGVRIATSMTTP